jgi:diguanylate cyclase (GGDEF)-like protein
VTDDATADPSDELALLTEITSALAFGGNVDVTLGRLLTAAGAAAGAPVGALVLQDQDRPDLQLVLTIGLDDERRAKVGAAVANETDAVAVVARDLAPQSVSTGGFVAAAGVVSAEIRPLVVRREGLDLPMGVLAIGWDEAHTLSANESARLDAIGAACAIAIDRGRLASLIAERSEWFERMAHSDPLTGLANQRTFARVLELELARAGRHGGEVSVAIFDIDGLAETNTLAGHETGDDVLRSVAAVLAESVRLVDTVARSGGDEFVVVAPGSAGMTVARRVLEGVAALEPIKGRTVSVSAGVARFPDDGTSADELLAAAHTALDRARAKGGGELSSATITAG